VSGYYRDGKWLTAVIGGYRESTEEAEREVAEATRRVVAGETTAKYELRRLLKSYPSLKLDRDNQPLNALAGLYAEEQLKG
jgi:uncharacterized membrane protein